MMVMKGFSIEVGHNDWAKNDVTLDKDDLRDLLLENGKSVEKLTTRQAYAILSVEVERLVTVEYVLAYKHRGHEVPEGLTKRLEDLTAQVKNKIAQVEA
jgi:hypothetical protein